ncbi:hypothetical protein NUW58_g693 [Xylaria curta]|uniref:Uncharacterized protein n=1 Tax=Xylaria curta TaxID=42375 RepID=A0ACC1PNF0_9PEZI|nr:hypothetical protein NUW58_g693 [Xylaria curta]
MSSRSARGRFQADLQAARREKIPNVQEIGPGDMSDVARYPLDNQFLVYTNNDVPPKIGKILDDAMGSTPGMSITELVKALSRTLRDSLDSAGWSGDSGIEVEDDVATTGPNSDADFSDDSVDDDDDYFDLGGQPNNRDRAQIEISDITLKRICQDFRVVQDAGFRVGKICGMHHGSELSIMTVSVKARKLGLSREIHEAWNLEPSDYVLLLMRYTGYYVSLDDALNGSVGHTSLEFRLRKCSKYRPTSIEEATKAFSPALESHQQTKAVQNAVSKDNSVSTFGVGDSIDLLLNGDFLAMVKIRKENKNASWDDSRIIHSKLALPDENNESTNISLDSIADTDLPPILGEDHLLSSQPVSLPLISMQFALRYLIKCTDYCMICHNKVNGNSEAVKPYVCGKPLCLFQYMSLGLGPSIDDEIIAHQYVVDLLISFCYSSLRFDGNLVPKMREFPLGLDLQVPCVRGLAYKKKKPQDITIPGYGNLIDPLKVTISWKSLSATIISNLDADRPGLAIGQWVVIHTRQNCGQGAELNVFHHARIVGRFGPHLHFRIASRHPVPMASATYTMVTSYDWDNASSLSGWLVLCNQSLDELEDKKEMALSLNLLLSALPPVEEMRSYLIHDKSRQLATWDQIPPGARKLLRWIIASNRSYIVQLDKPSNEVEKIGDAKYETLDRSQERTVGVDGWIQFRFVQGSLEKEARFLEASRTVMSEHRTILAWHGSPIGNWHSIIREGLNFDVISHGRAFGDGVYFSRAFEQSVNYSSGTDNSFPTLEMVVWPQSSLKIIQAISLNELVNRPEEFRHSKNCYVVDKVHWIQCRYLFVRPRDSATAQIDQEEKWLEPLSKEFKQDPQFEITGPRFIFVPEIGIPWVEHQQQGTSSSSPSTPCTPTGDDTDDEDMEDIKFLSYADSTKPRATNSENSMNNTSPPPLGHKEHLTDFRPGRLDFSKLPQLAPPFYATKSSQQTIQRELHRLQQIQSVTPLHELGWYIDFERIENMFQWIVEIHSFDPSLPLARDMKAAGVTSVVLEIRFMRGFPLTPPFVRVVQPRFLPFGSGGGGHVTAGGAMCMELLTNTGWSPVNTMESVLLQVRLAISSTEPAARLEESYPLRYGNNQYSLREAVDAYTRAAGLHGWEVPKEVREISMVYN